MVVQDVCEDMGIDSAWSKMLMCWTVWVDQWGAENCDLMQCVMRWLKKIGSVWQCFCHRCAVCFLFEASGPWYIDFVSALP